MSAPLRIPGAVNLRDVGGLPASGGVTRAGVLLRSGSLSGLDAAGRDALAELRLAAIIDLRDDDEVIASPSALDDRLPVPQRVPLFLGSAASFFIDDIGLPELYRGILALPDRLAAVARGVLGGHPVLVHCTVGKDRTGVAVALLLAAAGVERDAVVADYARTEASLPAERNRRLIAWLRQAHPDAVHLEELVSASPAAVMTRTLAELDRDHGSPAGYLRDAGLDAADLAELRRVLVTENRLGQG
ncbi:MAG: tyrosine-protein phosphatase [Microbacterium sp.]|uniref:tyrosine-protein phosphatase n=1 Tax=Microbacterium sp. TaxID=51671 RepID=UPI0039E6C019